MTVISNTPIKNETIIDAYLSKLPKRAPDDTSDVILESGRFKYKLRNDWAKMPADIKLVGVPAIATDGKDRVYVFNRAENPVLVFDRDGNLIDHWGEGVFTRPHGIFVGPDGMVWLVDDGDHTVRKCTPEGKVLMTLGTPHKPAPFMSGDPFCRCTDVALSPQGEIYVTDGYFNARIHKFSPDGKLMFSWGAPGTLPGEFNVVHNIICDAEGRVYVTDRENQRVQIFDADGKFEGQWNNMHRLNSIDERKGPGEKLFYIGESGPNTNANRHMPNCGPSVLILDAQGNRLAKLGTQPSGVDVDRFLSCHALAVDSHDDIYVGDNTGSKAATGPSRVSPIKKLEKIAG